jgi:dTDP-4-amino-4,6-dideoxygalactose transaminase
MALGIGPGDEVICPSFTFFATAGCVARLGATPVFADIDIGSFNVSVGDVRRKISKKTCAILPVHLFGQTADIGDIVKIGDEFGIPIVEDCAQSMGAKYNGRQSGTFGAIGCFSFYPTKNLGGFGDSGAVCTDNDAFAEKMRILRVHGERRKYVHERIGCNFRMDEIQAALLNVKMPRLDGYIAGRRRNAEIYLHELGDVKSIVLPSEGLGNFHTWNQFTIRVLRGRRDEIRERLERSGIGCNVYYPLPLDRQECFGRFVDGCPGTVNAKLASEEVLSLPIYPELSVDQIFHVTKVLKSALGE